MRRSRALAGVIAQHLFGVATLLQTCIQKLFTERFPTISLCPQELAKRQLGLGGREVEF